MVEACGGRGRACFNLNSKKSVTTWEMKFVLHTVGAQQQSITCDTVKDHVVQHVQKNCKNGIDIAESLNKETMKDLEPSRPARKISVKTDQAEKTLEQDGFNIEHEVKTAKHLKGSTVGRK